jgi:threonine/homoserine/homoserine lactone efflux protein
MNPPGAWRLVHQYPMISMILMFLGAMFLLLMLFQFITEVSKANKPPPAIP